MRTALFPVKATPWHQGHSAVLLAGCKAFDQVLLVVTRPDGRVPRIVREKLHGKVKIVRHYSPLVDLVEKVRPSAILRGMRSPYDFEGEKVQQYFWEDSGIKVPIFYVLSPREIAHVSGSMIRAVYRTEVKGVKGKK
jgi:pantetheine-phosphate adenylyltransferase